MQISFEPHPNENITDTQCVLIDGNRVGYCGTEAERPICFICNVSEQVIELVQKAVEENVGKVASVNQPPEQFEDIEIEGEDDDDSDEE